MSREQRLAQVLVELADTLVAHFDAVDFLHTLTERCVELLDIDAAGLMLSDQRGSLRVVASSTEQTRLLELFELQNDEGPCLDCFRTGEQQVNIDLDEVVDRWPNFTTRTAEAGFHSVHALPLRLRTDVIGAVNLFCIERAQLSQDDLAIGQAMADMATIGLLQERSVRQKEALAEQLQSALNTRVLIEQAKGAFAAQTGVPIRRAFELLRTYARNNGRPLREVATAVIDSSIDTAALMAAQPAARN